MPLQGNAMFSRGRCSKCRTEISLSPTAGIVKYCWKQYFPIHRTLGCYFFYLHTYIMTKTEQTFGIDHMRPRSRDEQMLTVWTLPDFQHVVI